eukprot:359919-Chlamydomonas_euryale.AAC.12
MDGYRETAQQTSPATWYASFQSFHTRIHTHAHTHSQVRIAEVSPGPRQPSQAHTHTHSQVRIAKASPGPRRLSQADTHTHSQERMAKVSSGPRQPSQAHTMDGPHPQPDPPATRSTSLHRMALSPKLCPFLSVASTVFSRGWPGGCVHTSTVPVRMM